MLALSDIFLLLPGYYVYLGGVCLIILGALLNSTSSPVKEHLKLHWLTLGVFASGLSRILMAFDSLFPESVFLWSEAFIRLVGTLFIAEFFRKTWFNEDEAVPAYMLHIPLAAIIGGLYLVSGGRTYAGLIIIFLIVKCAALLAGLKLARNLATENRLVAISSFLLAICAVLLQTVLHLAAVTTKNLIPLSEETLYLILHLDLAILLSISALVIAVRYLRENAGKLSTQTSFGRLAPAVIFIAIICVTVFGLRLSHSMALQQNQHATLTLEKAIQLLTKIVDQRFAFASTSSLIMGSAPIMSDYFVNPSPENLERLNRYLKNFTANNPGAICYIMDRSGIVHASSDLEHLFIGKDLSFRDYFKSAIQGKSGVQIDIGVLTSTLGFYSSYPIRGPDGQVIGVCAVKRNLDDLDKTLRLYHPAMIADATGTVFLSSDFSYLGRQIAVANRSARSITPLKAFPELQFPEIEASRYLLGIEPLQTLDSKVLMLMESNVRNNQIWVLMVILLIVIVFVVILNGITRTAEVMRSLEVAQNRFKTLFDNAPESIFVVSLVTLKIIEANQSMLRQFQLTQSAIGMNYFDLMPTKKRNLTNSWHSASKKMFKHEREFRKQTGEIFSAEVTGAIMEFNRERALLLILHDITMHREIESRLREAKNAAEEANALKGRFFANASHEIRTPMTAIIGLTELAASNCADDRQKHMLELIRSSSKSMLTLLNDIFDLAQIASGKLTINPVQFNLHLLLKDLVEIIQFQAEKKSVRTLLKINPDVPEMVISDPDRIRQILLNLLANAIKFIHHGEVRLNTSLLKTSHSACIIEFSVSDSRAGNSEQMQKNLFGAFVFNDPYIKDEKRDNSLGLSISKQLIDLMGGKISVMTNVEEGTTFKVSIPVTIKSIAASHTPETTESISLTRDGRPLNFLIADDNEINLFLASSIIEKFNGTATCVNDGIEAIAALKANRFDAVLMDIQMPRMDGIAALKEIRKMSEPTAGIPVIAISAFASEQEKNMARDAGAQSYISKPYFPEDLLKAISEIFADRTAEESSPVTTTEEVIVKAPVSGLKQIDRNELELRVLKKPENILQINEIFQRRSGILQKDLEDCVSTRNCERLRETAHSIKGLAGMLAAANAFELAREIEFLSRDGKFDQAVAHIPALKKLLNEIAEDLNLLKSEIEQK